MASRRNSSTLRVLATAGAVALSLAACGGGGEDGGAGESTTPTTNQGTLSGTAIKGPVSAATVTAYAIANGVVGAPIASATTDAQGAFTMSMGNYSGPVMLRSTGGAFTDEARGTMMAMAAGDAMTAVLPGVPSGSTIGGIRITPLTSMAHSMAEQMSGGLVEANIAAANAAVSSYFMVGDVLRTMPMNPLVAGSATGATPAMMNYGMTLAAMSQYAMTLGMPVSSTMVARMASDSSDGVMNGMIGTRRIELTGGGMMGGARMMDSTAGTSGLAAAMAEFMASGMNRSGVTATHMAALMQQLGSSGGQLR